jgi:hypothetical protein
MHVYLKCFYILSNCIFPNTVAFCIYTTEYESILWLYFNACLSFLVAMYYTVCVCHVTFFGSGTGVWTQGLVVARQVLYCFSYNPSPFLSFFFSLGIFWGGLTQAGVDLDPPIFTSGIAGWQVRVTTPSFYLLKQGLANFLPGAGFMLLISASQVAKMTRVSHCGTLMINP